MSFDLFFSTLFDDFINPSERLFWPALLLSIILAWSALLSKKDQAFLELRKSFFSKEIWLHPSSLVDMKFFFLNNFLRLLFLSFFAGFLVSSHSLSVWFIGLLKNLFGDIRPIATDWFAIRLSYTLFAFVLLDFLRFVQHFLMHKCSWLWRFHRIHHSAEVLTPLTLNRMHPVEMFIGMARTTLAVVISSSLYIYLFQVPLYGFEILGVNMFGFLFNALGANLRHSHIWLGFGPLEYIFVSPAQHQIHHSKNPRHHHKNFGVCLSVWDIVFGSFLKTNKKLDLKFGL